MAETVLIVDDQPVMLDMLKECLESMGYETSTASNANEGLRRLYERRPDLVITDLWMPGMDGFEFSRIIRYTCDVPIMMLTAVGRTEGKTYDLNLVDEYLEKPVTIEELEDRIRVLLHGKTVQLAPRLKTGIRIIH